MKFLCLLFLLICNFCDARINFIHIYKCGGTTIKGLLRENFHESEIYAFGGIGANRNVNITKQKHMRKVFDEFPEINHEVVWGHLPMWFFQKKDPDYDTAFFFTVLRDPVQRILSQDRFWMKRQKKENKKIHSNPLSIPPNLMCKMLCSDPSLTGEKLLENSIRSLERMDYIIFMDDFDNGIKNLFNILNLKCPKNIPYSNISSSQEFIQNITPELIAEIKKLNYLDIQLYNYAKENLRFHLKEEL